MPPLRPRPPVMVQVAVRQPFHRRGRHVQGAHGHRPALAVAQAEHTGAMVALVPIDDDAARLRLPGGERAEDLHLTLWFLGEAADWTVPDRDATVAAMTKAAAGLAPVQARGFGANHWNPAGDEPSWVLAVGDAAPDERDGPTLEQVHEVTGRALPREVPEQHSPWSPHVCVAYSADTALVDAVAERVGPLTFDRVRVAFGPEVTDIPLGGPDAMSAAADPQTGDAAMPYHTERDRAECSSDEPVAVVKDDDGEVMGCHPNEEAAQRQMDALHAGEDDGDMAARTVAAATDKPWDGAASRFTDEQYSRAAAACDPGDAPPKQRCFLPHHEPDGTVSRPGVHAAAARASQLSGRDPGAVSRAKAHLRGHYTRDLDEDPPDSIAAEADTVAAGGKPNPGTKKDKRLKRNMSQAGEAALEGEPQTAAETDLSPGDPATAAWQGVLTVEGIETGDGREFATGSLTWDDSSPGAMPLMWQKVTSHGGGTDESVRVGTVLRVWREDDGRIMGQGVFDLGGPDGDDAHESYRRMRDGFLTGNSVDVDSVKDADVTYVWPEGGGDEPDLMDMLAGPEKVIFTKGRIRGTTLVEFPAFTEARLALIEDGTAEAEQIAAAAAELVAHRKDDMDEAMVAAVASEPEWRPPRGWFEDPGFRVLTPIVVTEDGRVYGHAAQFGECHLGFDGQCVQVPRERSFDYFLTGKVITDDGSAVAVGQITAGIGHAPLSMGARPAAEHYDDTSAVVADVTVGNDELGVWVAGAVRPDAQAARVRALRASGQVSPDWRGIGGQLRMVGLLTVNVSGFQVPRVQARVASGQVQALVAAGVPNLGRAMSAQDIEAVALRVERDRILKRMGKPMSDREG